MLRAKNFLREIDDRTKTGEETLLSMRQHRGLVPHNDVSVKRIAPENLIGYKKAQPDELVLNRMQAGNAMFFRNRLSGLVSPDYAVFRLLRDDSPEYLGYLFRSWPIRGLFRSESKGLGTGTSGFLRLYSDRFAALEIPLPPRPEQDQIVAYLQVQDAHIARLIKAKRDLIDLLIEQKLRIIDHAVTGGLDAAVALKPSGIEWLGDVPEHWEVAFLKHIADVRFSGVDKHSHDDETPVRLCNYTDVYKNDRITGDMDLMRATATAAEIARLTLNAGDVILTKDSETPDDIGVPAWVPEDLPGVVCAYHLGLLRPEPERVLGEFLFRAIGSARVAQQFHVLATGVTRFALGKHDVKNAVIALPPVDEQKTICKWINDECRPLEDAIQRAEEEIKLIREYRDRQIADVVTGQVDVRGWVPGPDDVVAEEDLAALGGDEEIDTDGEEDDGDD
ncbi:restriction endonuclease subunit S [Ralstonia solanacearum]|uniref:restriction endonuclease subunit S n=1 Tax=Ralstonia solanacearum TaxID=305 RepID=UPI000A5E8F28|nr:restriction endonuclease subunit S [Ralstonia solanacearum]MCL9826601.1 restriction endonuclease subunit S [Ralstonia solanacearum]MCL9831449.1 restriction endonuclease subunit S [Ralstonia solanacearum]MCL9836230.1 restriction endonuclease subunit S [Ralstonia solanacearum]